MCETSGRRNLLLLNAKEFFPFRIPQRITFFRRYIPDPYAYVTLKSHLALFDIHDDWDVFQVFTPHTNIDGSFFGCWLYLIKRTISHGVSNLSSSEISSNYSKCTKLVKVPSILIQRGGGNTAKRHFINPINFTLKQDVFKTNLGMPVVFLISEN